MRQTGQASRLAVGSFAVLALGVSTALAGAQGSSQSILRTLGGDKGICVILDDPHCELALGLAPRSEFIFYVQVRNPEDRQTACQAADAAGYYGTRINVSGGDPRKICLADNLADAVVAASDWEGPPKAEVVRVLQPGGKALLKQATFT